MRIHHAACMTILLALITAKTGCDKDEGLARMAEEHARRQAAQSQQMAELQREVAEGAKELVEADARARGKIIALERDIQTERAEVGQQRDQLEEDRRDLAAQRKTDPIVAAAITQVGMLVACILPLVLCWYLLFREPSRPGDAAVTEVLIEDLTAERPMLLPPAAERRAAIACEDPLDQQESRDGNLSAD